jgi:hypothetical protein
MSGTIIQTRETYLQEARRYARLAREAHNQRMDGGLSAMQPEYYEQKARENASMAAAATE